MNLFLFLKGLVIGFSIAAPVGPIGLLCIVRTLSGGLVAGLATGLGAAVADGLYGCIGGFGISVVGQALVGQQFWFRLIGGFFLIYLGIRNFMADPEQRSPSGDARSLLGSFGSTFVLTLTNPMTIIAFAAVFASLGVGISPGTYGDATTLIIGIFCGSALWWLVLSFGVSLFRKSVSPNRLGWINKIAGTVITGFGLAALASLAM